jgi:RNA repair, ligase-Pnkp-associating, region of Hen1
MLLTISTSHKPATDLGYLLHKNPARVQTEDLSFGTGHVFYPEASSARCTAALLVEIDPVALVRGRGPAGESGQLEQYVNDRPYAANSFLSVAMGRMFTTAMSGRSKERQQLADTAIPLTANLPVIAAREVRTLAGGSSSPSDTTSSCRDHVLMRNFRIGENLLMWRSPLPEQFDFRIC